MKQKFFLLALFATLFLQSSAGFVFAAGTGGGGGGTQPNANPYLPGIKNTAIDPILGGDAQAASSGSTFTTYFILLWQGLIVIGTLAMLFNLINGALEWVTAGGEAEKVKHARMKMTEGVVGLIILLGTFAAVMFIGQVLGFNVLQFKIPTPSGA